MKRIVITGSTRGIGFALGREFLKRNCQVVFSGRKESSVQKAVDSLLEDFPQSQILGIPCDVRDYDQVAALWKQSVDQFGVIDIWINNAGISNEQNPPWEIEPEAMKAVVETNILGELYGTKVAMQGFLDQGFGALYNVEGMGADGKTHNVKGFSVYGTTKAGLHFFNKTLAQENDHPRIITGAIQPGMVLTDLITGQYEDRPDKWEEVKGILGIIANPIDDVASWLTEKILANRKNGAYLKFGGTLRILKRFVLAPLRRGKSD